MRKQIQLPRHFGQAIRKKRQQLGLTQQDLSDSAGASRALIYRLEKGIASGVDLFKLLSILDVLELRLFVEDISADDPEKDSAAISEKDAGTPSDHNSEIHQHENTEQHEAGGERSGPMYQQEAEEALHIPGFDAKRFFHYAKDAQ